MRCCCGGRSDTTAGPGTCNIGTADADTAAVPLARSPTHTSDSGVLEPSAASHLCPPHLQVWPRPLSGAQSPVRRVCCDMHSTLLQASMCTVRRRPRAWGANHRASRARQLQQKPHVRVVHHSTRLSPCYALLHRRHPLHLWATWQVYRACV